MGVEYVHIEVHRIITSHNDHSGNKETYATSTLHKFWYNLGSPSSVKENRTMVKLAINQYFKFMISSFYTKIENHEDFHLKTLAIENDAQLSLITLLETSDWTMFKIPVNRQNLIQIYHVFQDL